MQWEYNQYYPLSQAGDEVLKTATTLLQAFPMTRAFLGILGRELLLQLQVGLFDPGQDLIVEGEKGRDLILLCSNQIDVLVKDKVVVSMKAPVLLGDKAVITPISTRAATIRVAQGAKCLVMLIPLGNFLKNFLNPGYDDELFAQERRIFLNLFQEIQNRLFEYAFVQKNLYEEATTTLNLLNRKLVASLLEQGNGDWPNEVWGDLEEFLKAKTGFETRETFGPKSFKPLLVAYLDKKYPRNSFQCSDGEYQARREQLWRGWLNQAAAQVNANLTEEQRPLNLGEIHLFSPLVYQARLNRLFRHLRRWFPLRRTVQQTGADQTELAKRLDADAFFVTGEKGKVFDLAEYTKVFFKHFTLKYPNRTLARLAQSTAQVAAETENEFNASVVRMQDFLARMNSQGEEPQSQGSVREKRDDAALEKNSLNLLKGFSAYHARMAGGVSKLPPGEMHFVPRMTPQLEDLVKAAGSGMMKSSLKESLSALLKGLDLVKAPLRLENLLQKLYLCSAMPGFKIPAWQLRDHFWVPLSQGVRIMKGEELVQKAQMGDLLGGAAWQPYDTDESQAESWCLKMPERKPQDPMNKAYLFLVMPGRDLHWIKGGTESFEHDHLPLLQGLVNLYLSQLAGLEERRNGLWSQMIKLEEMIRLESRLKVMEKGSDKASPKAQKRIGDLLARHFGEGMREASQMPAATLTQKLYDHIVQVTGDNHENLSWQEIENRAYTEWRYLLGEIVRIQDAVEQTKDRAEEPEPLFPLVAGEVGELCQARGYQGSQSWINLETSPPQINLEGILGLAEKEREGERELVQALQQVFEKAQQRLLLEMKNYRTRLEEVAGQLTKGDEAGMKQKFILDQVELLLSQLSSLYPALAEAQKGEEAQE